MAFYYLDAYGVQVGSKEKFTELTGAEFITEMQIPPDCVLQNIYPENNAERDLARLLDPLYNGYKKSPPKLYLRKGTCKGCHSVCALEPITKGKIVTEYLGEWNSQQSRNSSYRWGPINGLHFRNYGGMVEDGFPNVGAFHLYNREEVPLRVVFVAIDDIPADQMITIHYGMNHSVKVLYHDEYRVDEMSLYFSLNSIESIVKRIKQLRVRSPKELGWKNSLELESLTVKLRYLFQTPSALFQLILRGIIKAEDAFCYYEQADFRYFLLGLPFNPNARQRENISYFNIMKRFFTERTVYDLDAIQLLASMRQRIFYSLYINGIMQGHLQEENLIQEAVLWNAVFDAIQQENKALAEFKIEQSTQKIALIQASVTYAKEIESSLIPWLVHLSEPSVPLSPVGT